MIRRFNGKAAQMNNNNCIIMTRRHRSECYPPRPNRRRTLPHCRDDKWQAWLYCILILGAGIGGRIWAEQRHPGLTAERQNIGIIRNAKAWDKVLAPLMAVSIGYPMVLVAGLDHRFNWSPEFPLWLIAIGFISISIGYAFAAWALVENRFFYSVVCVASDRGHMVCDSGPYAIVRHPGYAGNILGLFGIVLALGSVWALIPAMVASIIAVIRTVLEDQTLHAELPGYPDYSSGSC